MPDNISDADILRRAAQINRAKQGPSATEARRAGMAKTHALRTLAACTCGRTDGSHAVKCPVYRREAQQRYRAGKTEKETNK